MSEDILSVKWPGRVELGKSVAGVVTMSAPDGALCPKEQTDRGVDWLAARGCGTKFAPHFSGNAGFLAASPREIAADINGMAQDPDVDFIISAGGGYNANALLRHLDYEALARAGKPIIGLSNPTVLLNAISAKTGLVTYHGPVLIHNLGSAEGIDAFTENHFRGMLGGCADVIRSEPEWVWLRRGEQVSGRLYGGNLWSLEHLLGTPFEPDWRGAILFLEDCFCELHQVYASLEHFKAAGVFDKIAALVLGIPLEVAETELPYTGTFNDIVMETVGEYAFPVLGNVHLGHTDRKLTLPIGALCTLDATRNVLSIERN